MALLRDGYDRMVRTPKGLRVFTVTIRQDRGTDYNHKIRHVVVRARTKQQAKTLARAGLRGKVTIMSVEKE